MMSHGRLLCFAAIFSFASIATPQSMPDLTSSRVNFEPNLGQTSAEVAYLVQRPSHQVLITPQSLIYVFPTLSRDRPLPQARAFTFRWTGPASTPHFTPSGTLLGHSNYFLTSDASHGITNIPHYARVREDEALRGVAIRYHSGMRGELEYDFVVSGQTPVTDISITIDGAEQLRIDKDGTLIIFAAGREWLRQPAPQAYEMRDGRKVALQAAYVLNGAGRVALSVPGRTPGSEVVIDPVVVYGTLLGVHDPMYRWADEGGPYSYGLSTAVDPAGNFFVAGQTYAFDFPVTPRALQKECPWDPTVACVYTPLDFVTKFSSSGQLLYSTYLGGDYGFNPYHQPTGKILAVDGNGFAYIAGEAGSNAGFPVTANAFQTSCHSDNGCATLTKLNQNGSALVYSTYFGGTMTGPASSDGPNDTYANALALASNGDVFLAGGTRNSNLPTTSGAYQYACLWNDGQCRSGFVARFDPTANGTGSRIFATYVGTSDGAAEIESVAVDRYDDVYVLGLSTADMPHIASFGTGMFPAGYGSNCQALGAPCETFLSKLSGNYGQSLRDSTILRGVAGKSVAVDSSLNAFIAGTATSGLATTSGAFQAQFKGGSTDGFITKLDPSGYFQLFSTYLGGGGDDTASDIAVNSWGMAFVTGFTNSTDFPLGPGAFDKTHSGGYVAAFNADGRSLYYSTLIGGSGGAGICLDSAWNAVVTGIGSDTTPLTANALQTQMAGWDDAFALKIAVAADLRLSDTDSTSSIARNGVVIYHARVLNAGPDGSDSVTFTDNIPAGMVYAGVYVPNGNGCTEPPLGAGTGTLTCRKTRLESGQTWYVNVYLRAVGSGGTKVTNQMRTSAKTQDLWPANNSVSSTVSIQ